MTTPVIYKFILLFMSVFVIRPNISVEAKENCAQKLDLVIIVDTSSSVTGPNFKLSIAFIQNLLRPLQIGPDNIRVALMRYSTDVDVVSYLGERMNKEEKEKDLLKIKYKYGNTHTHEALRKTTTDVLVEKKGDRPEVQDLVVLITDGKSTKRGTKEEAMKLKSKQYLKILTIGVTKEIDEPELMNVSSGADFFLKIDSFADFNRHLDQLKLVVCSGGDVSLNAQLSVQGVKGNNDSSLQNFETSTTFKTSLTSFNHHNKMITFMPSTITHQPESVSSHVDSGSIFSTSSVFFVTSVPSLPLITLDSSVMPSLSILPTLISPLPPVSETSLLPSFMNTDLFSSIVMQEIVATSSLAFSESDFRTSQSIKDTVVLPWISDHDTLSPTFSSPIYLSSFILNTAMFPPPSSSEIMPSLVSSGSEIRSSITETGVLDISSSNLDTINLPSSSILEIGRIFPSPSISDSVISPSPSMSNTVISPFSSISDTVILPSPSISDTVTFSSPSISDIVIFSSPSISDTVLFPLILPSITDTVIQSLTFNSMLKSILSNHPDIPLSNDFSTISGVADKETSLASNRNSLEFVSESGLHNIDMAPVTDTLKDVSNKHIDTLVSPSSMSIDTLMSSRLTSVSKTTSLKVYPRDSQEYLPLISNEQSSIFFSLENSKTVSKTVSLTSTVQVMSTLLSMINYLDQNREPNNKMPSFLPTNSIMTSKEVSFSLPKELSSLSSVRTASLKNNKLLESFTSYTNQFSERAQPTSSSVWHQSVMIENYNASILTGAETRRTLWTYMSAAIAGFIAVLLAGIFLAVVSRKNQERAREEATQINVEAQ
ncbi:collagen alpha-6(VI) chain [Biomphalaria pfeifferi]|uniref:Collagen alpha-6(VI) chain n=1 Tax=Biomphalaria pfeifferi TaxID=112525 RepID=A0AAD8AYU0_BIOPF|nr:collagen alpha-6(VI) chain [Biomphalaria pfeifferi]